MRIDAIELRNFRGVDERRVELAPAGVTIIEGPNEIGKSSMAEAIDRLFEDMDSTAKQRVLALKPVNKDVGPEVMVEGESGPYVFRYRKRFLRERLTELSISRPRSENRTGREAHERMQAILAETLDVPLWKALRIQQGDVVGQASLTAQTSLSAALDRSAGASPAGEAEVAIYDRVHDEYLQFWTETGRRKQIVAEMERQVAQAEADVERLTQALAAIDEDVERSRRLETSAKTLVERNADATQRVTELQARADGLAKLEATVEAEIARFEAAQLTETQARRSLDQRKRAAASAADAREECVRLNRALAEDDPQREAAARRVTEAEAVVRAAKEAVEGLRTEIEVMRAADARARDRDQLRYLKEVRARVVAARSAIEGAAHDASFAINQAQLDSIRTLHRSIEIGRARFTESLPSVTVRALVPLTADFNGEKQALTRGQRRQHRIDAPATLAIADTAVIEIDPQYMSTASAERLEADSRKLDELLEAAGAKDIDDAERMLRRRLDAQRTVAEQTRVIQDLVGKSSRDDLDTRIAELEGRIAERGARQLKPVPKSFAGRTIESAAEELEALTNGLVAAEAEFDAALKRAHELDVERATFQTECRLAEEEASREEAALAEDRANMPDEELAAGAERAATAREAHGQSLAAARLALAAQGAEEVKILLDNARSTLDRVATETRQVQDELLEVTTRLRDHGEDGLAEDLDEAVSIRDEAEHELRQFEARAAARQLLYQTFREEREASRRNYVTPLRQEIERLGKVVFGPDFEVELDDLTLAVVSRTLHGRTIPFESLSIGAREQIALITRLACATIVAADGGVPVILDDALGNSDPQRLEALGAVLSTAGKQCQIIVLTCQPHRYEHVGNATTVRL